jgi:hypothetical protein
LSFHLQADITYTEKPLTHFTKNSAAIERIKASGLEEEKKFIKGDFERLAGRKPETFADYLMKEETMGPAEKKIFPKKKHTLTMMPKIEQDFPDEPHFITLVARTGDETATTTKTAVAQ